MFNLKIMLMFTLMLSMLLIMINLMISKKKLTDREKASPFECGFDPLSSARLPFSMQFYMISIIFLIFDVEIMIFLPLIPSFNINKFSMWLETGLIFVTILLIGIYIEWNDGALKWLK